MQTTLPIPHAARPVTDEEDDRVFTEISALLSPKSSVLSGPTKLVVSEQTSLPLDPIHKALSALIIRDSELSRRFADANPAFRKTLQVVEAEATAFVFYRTSSWVRPLRTPEVEWRVRGIIPVRVTHDRDIPLRLRGGRPVEIDLNQIVWDTLGFAGLWFREELSQKLETPPFLWSANRLD